MVIRSFRDAWKALRLLKSPDIATYFGDGNKYYKVPLPEELESWLDQTFYASHTGDSVQSVMLRMQNYPAGLPTCYLVPNTAGETFKGSIILFISHWRTEATGSFNILDQLFDYAIDLLAGSSTAEALSRHNLGDEVKLLTPSLEDLLVPEKTTSEAKAKVEKRFAQYTSHLPSIDLPILKSFTAAPSRVKINQRIYTPSSTSSLVLACRSRSITVTSAIHSAYIGAIYRLAEEQALPAVHNNDACASSHPSARVISWREQGCWNAAQMLLLTVPAGQDFVTRAKALRTQYAIAGDEAWLCEDMRETSEQTLEHFSLVPQEPSALPWLTSMGVLDGDYLREEHGELRVEGGIGLGRLVGSGDGVGLVDVQGRLNLQIHWNVAFHADDQVEEILKLIDETLKVELGVEMVIHQARVMEV